MASNVRQMKAYFGALSLILVGCLRFPDSHGISSFGAEALAKISQSGIPVPPDAKEPFYYIDGFVDHTVFISFSATPSQAEAVIQQYAGVSFSDFTSWQNQIEHHSGSREPGHHGKESETPLYDMDTLKDAIIYMQHDPDYKDGFHFIYDRATERLYFCNWST